MRKRNIVLAGIIALASMAACCVFFGQSALKACFPWDCVPERSFHVLDWELPASIFPERAIVGHINPPADGNTVVEGGLQTIYIDQKAAVYTIYRFPTVKRAIAQYQRDKSHMVDPQTNSQWRPPETSVFSSKTADELDIACGEFFQYRCEMVARYQEYLVSFGAMIDDEMTYAQFEDIVDYIDKQISSRLYP